MKWFKKKAVQAGAIALDRSPDKLPRHIAMIMDGNGRWAKQRALPRTAGHRAGMETLETIIRACDELGIETLTVYAFSTENWARPKEEVTMLMNLLVEYFEKKIDELDRNGVCIRILGFEEQTPSRVREVMERACVRTRDNTGLKFNIAFNYGGRGEIVQAAKRFALDVAKGDVQAEALDEEGFGRYLFTAGLPEPDLLIRTSGEQRLSNFLLYQLAYAEFVFTDVYWPDYTKEEFFRSIAIYQSRSRRFGGV